MVVRLKILIQEFKPGADKLSPEFSTTFILYG
jgi:hypothetical protein